MKLEHDFTVPVPVEQAWPVLLDVERIAPCMPGATLLSVDGRDFTGSVKVKVGPITVTYNGKASFTELDESARRVVIEASGKETRGAGTAAATVTAQLVDAGSSTTVKVETDLNVTGRPAQFGRGVLAEVGAKLVGQFADCLADELANGGGSQPADTAVAAPDAPAAMSDLVAPGEPADPADVAEAESGGEPAKKTAKKAAKKAAKTAAASAAKTAAPAAKVAPAAKKAAPAKKAAKKAAAARDSDAKPTGGVAGANGATATPVPASAPPGEPSPPPRPRTPAEPIDLLDVAGGSVAKRVAPVAAALLILVLLLRRRRR